jgi:fumarate reductase subunit D
MSFGWIENGLGRSFVLSCILVPLKCLLHLIEHSTLTDQMFDPDAERSTVARNG